MRILAIETSCDETAVALLEASGGLKNPKFKVLKSLVLSQINIHKEFGGVVPSLAKREHQKNLPLLLNKISSTNIEPHPNKRICKFEKDSLFADVDLIAVTVGPGLEPALWTGITFAKQMCADLCRLQSLDKARGKRRLTQKKEVQLIGVNHMLGHLYSFLLPSKAKSSLRKAKNLFPAVALIVSGGHTILLLLESLTIYKKLGETRDDAAGEAFDKVARLLGLPYPGGPEIEKLAQQGDPAAVNFPRPMIHQKNYDFSFSGLKTAVLYHIKDRRLTINNLRQGLGADVAASFQQAIFDTLVTKTLRAAREYKAKSVILCGGVSASRTLREEFARALAPERVRFVVPPLVYSTDNAAMIAAAAYLTRLEGKEFRLVADGTLSI